VLDEHAAVDELIELLTMVLGPESLLVAARFDIADELTSRQTEALADELEQQLREAVPDVAQVFLDATRRRVAPG
jgi:divalent metal cation (Fe/Co/Zn/Cd) transporter